MEAGMVAGEPRRPATTSDIDTLRTSHQRILRHFLGRYAWKAVAGAFALSNELASPGLTGTRREGPLAGQNGRDMAESTNDMTSAFLIKASRYVERGMAEDHASEQHAYWLHFSVEPLLRAAVAHAHPALLADPRSNESLLAALGVGGYNEPTAFRSRPSSALVKLLGTWTPSGLAPTSRAGSTRSSTRGTSSRTGKSPR
jgi:hypothetical protein